MWTLKLLLPVGTRFVVGQPIRVPIGAITTQTISARNGQPSDPTRPNSILKEGKR